MSKTSLGYLLITISVMTLPMAFIQGHYIFKPSIINVFHNHPKVMKNLHAKYVCFVQQP